LRESVRASWTALLASLMQAALIQLEM